MLYLEMVIHILHRFLGVSSHGESHIVRFLFCGPKVYSDETDTERIEMKVKGMTQNGYTENILDLDQATGKLRRTGKNLILSNCGCLMEMTRSYELFILNFQRRMAKLSK